MNETSTKTRPMREKKRKRKNRERISFEVLLLWLFLFVRYVSREGNENNDEEHIRKEDLARKESHVMWMTWFTAERVGKRKESYFTCQGCCYAFMLLRLPSWIPESPSLTFGLRNSRQLFFFLSLPRDESDWIIHVIFSPVLTWLHSIVFSQTGREEAYSREGVTHNICVLGWEYS